MMILLLALLGLSMGSFVNALVWRLHNKRDFVRERSECTHCHHVLEWYDLIPVVSWAWLRGKCRYCRKPIEDSPLVEVGVAAAFAASYMWWPMSFSPQGTALFVVWLVSLVLLAALFLYDLKWTLLPNALVFPLIGLGVVWVALYYGFVYPEPPFQAAQSILFGLMSVAGIYGTLYAISRGEWIGFGDVKLGIFMGLVLGWEKGLLAVMLANLLALLLIAPGLVSGKMTRKTKIPFGPFLIVATVVSLLIGDRLIAGYISFMLGT